MTQAQRLALLNQYHDEVDAYRSELQGIVDKLEDRADAFHGRSTAPYGLLTAEAKVKWANHMVEALSDAPTSRPRRRSCS